MDIARFAAPGWQIDCDNVPAAVRSASIHLALCAVLCSAGCINTNPTPPVPVDAMPPAEGPAFADSVLTFQKADLVTDCTMGLPNCSSSKTQTGMCAGNAALGMNDQNFWVLNPTDTIVLGFTCSAVLSLGTPNGGTMASNDFQVFGTADTTSFPVVEVSADAVNFHSLNMWTGEGTSSGPIVDPFFQLAAADLDQIRYVRISNTGASGVVSIDAVEALRAVLQ